MSAWIADGSSSAMHAAQRRRPSPGARAVFTNVVPPGQGGLRRRSFRLQWIESFHSGSTSAVLARSGGGYPSRLTNRLRRPKLRHRACIEDVDFRQPRGLDKDLVLSLADGRWIREHLNVLITGPAGIGKSWIACALAHGACRNGYSAAYRRLTRLLTELSIARADGRYPKLLASLAKTHVLVNDDFGLAKLRAENRRDLLEIIEDRHALRSTIVTSQFPVEKWHAVVGDPTLADAILDRLVHRAYQLNLKGESMRKRQKTLTQTDHQSS